VDEYKEETTRARSLSLSGSLLHTPIITLFEQVKASLFFQLNSLDDSFSEVCGSCIIVDGDGLARLIHKVDAHNLLGLEIDENNNNKHQNQAQRGQGRSSKSIPWYKRSRYE
jgi:hypothetical protein